MSQISDSEIEDIMIEIQKMNLNETKEVNPIGHVGGPRKIKEEHPKTFETHYRIPKYEPRESNIAIRKYRSIPRYRLSERY